MQRKNSQSKPKSKRLRRPPKLRQERVQTRPMRRPRPSKMPRRQPSLKRCQLIQPLRRLELKLLQNQQRSQRRSQQQRRVPQKQTNLSLQPKNNSKQRILQARTQWSNNNNYNIKQINNLHWIKDTLKNRLSYMPNKNKWVQKQQRSLPIKRNLLLLQKQQQRLKLSPLVKIQRNQRRKIQ